MKNWKEMIRYGFQGMSKAVWRFPLTVLCLAGAAGLIMYMISLNTSPSLVIEKMMYTLLLGAFLGMAAQFSTERYDKLAKSRLGVYGFAFLLIIGYLLILWPAPEISPEITVRTIVAVFAMLCAMLWVPCSRGKADFNQIALVHFKSAFTSILYAGVLSGGMAAIIAAIDILLFDVNSDAYSYMLTVVWVLFAPIYYLSLLPKFNADSEADLELMQTARSYPKFLQILVSYISIPLVAAYTLVLLIYLIKIIVTTIWPSGQLGPMVLIYSAAGLIIFILASLLENKFAVFYRRIFPKILIPVVIMQLISVGIRLNAYGVTESRYYVALFGVFSLIIGVILSLKPNRRNGIIALLAAGLAIISIIPPVDAFTVSRVSQINRIEKILQAEGILSDGKLTPKANATEETKIETTNILAYLDRQSSLRYIQWLPEDFNVYQDLKDTFGFEPTYPNYPGQDFKYFYASLDAQKAIDISGYDISLMVHSSKYLKEGGSGSFDFTIDGAKYTLQVDRISDEEVVVSVKDNSGVELINTGFYDFAKELVGTGNEGKEALPPEKMTLEVSRNGYRLRVIFQNININYGPESDAGADYSAFVLFGEG